MPAAKSSTAKKTKVAEKVEVVHEPLKSDILCGKDKSCVSHEGSVRFRRIIDKYRERYCSDSTTKQQRMAITKEIYKKLIKSARFLKYDSKDKVWKTISALAARDKVSHALRFANLKENRKTGKVKNVRRRVSSSSTSSSASNTKATSPEDVKFWNSLVTRQAKLLESIKRGEKGSIPAYVDLPERITVSTREETPSKQDCDPLSINDTSSELNPTFQSYCMQFYRPEDFAGASNIVAPDDCTEVSDAFLHCEQRGEYYPSTRSQGSTDASMNSDKCLYEDLSVQDDAMSNECDFEDRGEEIASMIAQPLMEWDLEHDGIFEA